MWIFSFLTLAALITFQDLAEHQNQRIELKGFAYETKSGEKVLAAEPNLKCCCVGTNHKADQQVIIQGVEGPFSPYQVIHLEGKLDFQERRYYLKEASRVETQSNFWIYAAPALFILIALSGWRIFYSKKPL